MGVQGSRVLHMSNITSTSAQSPPCNSSEILTQGWTPSPSGRGSIDIVWSCVITMFLCSWSVLCLQIPGERDSRFDILWRRFWLTALCGLGPEFTFQLAQGQWASARRSVRDFHASGYPDWTMKHAFYADSGGFFLSTPDFKPIPIDAKQLLYLINHKYIEYPAFSEQNIDDKNKVDVLLRIISVGQTAWFIATVIARGAQGLVVTGMELTTAAFILCSFCTTYCWWYKAADVAVPTVLDTTTPMTQIIKDAGAAAAGLYQRTPLDFISREEWHWSLYWTHWINILRNIHISFAPRALPHDRIENTLWRDPKGPASLAAFILLCFAYSAIFLTGWSSYFPTATEQTLWRIASLGMMASVFFYCLITGFAYLIYPFLKRYFSSKKPPDPQSQSSDISSTSDLEHQAPATQIKKPRPKASRAPLKLLRIAASIRNNSVSKDPSLDVPLKATLPIYLVGVLYCSSRTMLLILDMIQFRSLPSSAFATVDWNAFIPHLA